MLANNSLQTSCNLILNTIRSSFLNYAVQETPYSLYVTIRKSEAKVRDPENKLKSEDANNIQTSVISHAAFSRLKSDFEDTLAELEAKNEYISKLEAVLANSDEKLSKLEDLDLQFHKVIEENKAIKKENDTLNRNIKVLTEQIKTSEKTVSDNRKLQIKMERLATENTKIKNYRDKVKEEMKLSNIESKDAITELEQKINTLETGLKLLSDKKVSENASQTDQHPEIPYKVTDQLPPIFSSQLCHHSRRIYLSNSLPNLDSICWSKPSKDFIDEAEEALAEQYDNQVKEFYLDERERVTALREQQHQPPGPET